MKNIFLLIYFIRCVHKKHIFKLQISLCQLLYKYTEILTKILFYKCNKRLL